MANNYFIEQSHIDILWAMGYTGKGIRVGLVDSGIRDINHPSIKNKIVAGRNFSLDRRKKDDISSRCFHGEAVASLITEVAPDIELVVAKALDNWGTGNPNTVAEAIRYCVNQGCDIINCSVATFDKPKLAEAVKWATDKGVIIVSATGNDGKYTKLYPSSYEEVISVGAIDKDCNLAYFSNYNEYIDVVALGVDLQVAIVDGGTIGASGTSFSAPLVAGTLALLKQKFIYDNKREPSRDELYNIMIGYCKVLDNIEPEKQGFGYICIEEK